MKSSCARQANLYSPNPCNQQGFTLVEVLVAMTLFAIVSALMAPAFLLQLKTNIAAEDRNGAIAVAQQVLDDIRTSDPSTLPSTGSTTSSITTQHRSYATTTTYCSTSSFCTARTRHIKLEIKYRGKTVYWLETVFTKLK